MQTKEKNLSPKFGLSKFNITSVMELDLDNNVPLKP